MSLYKHIGKRGLDLTLAFFLLIALSPLLIVISILVRLNLGTPSIFQQERLGYLGKPFTLYKFRTMKNTLDSTGNLLPDSARLTLLGVLLRNLSLDELPQFINVLRGDMSLVGPRPLLKECLSLYTPDHARRHLLKPGLTGWAQIHGRNSLAWRDKLNLDVFYVDHLSFFLDLKIIFKTFSVVFKREGICAQGHANMPQFRED